LLPQPPNVYAGAHDIVMRVASLLRLPVNCSKL
jgi:hypothetical protein